MSVPRRCSAAAVVISILLGAAQSQETSQRLEAGTPADEPRNIQVIDVVVVESELGGAFREPLKCDSEGSVYVRGYDAVLRSKIPIRKFDTQKGVRLASFSLDSAPGLEFETGDEFFVAPDGELYWLTATKSERYILTFAKDGTFKGKVKLEFGKPFLPYQLAVFAGGEFLISGLNPEDPGKKSDKKPFTGIFDKQGRLVKRIALQDDDAIHEAAQRGDSNFTSELYPGQGNRAVSQDHTGAVRAQGFHLPSALFHHYNPSFRRFGHSALGDGLGLLPADHGRFSRSFRSLYLPAAFLLALR